MITPDRLQSLFHQGPFSRQRYLAWMTLFCFLILGYFFITWPIIAYDTDLWYHLSGGRYFFENLRIADTPYFSFLAPEKSWYNYYWLFQVIAYTFFSSAGYYGLVVFRCLIFLATAFFIYRQLVQKEDDSRIIGFMFFFIVATIALTSRELLVRPHLFSYLFITIFLYLLEKRRDLLWLLPILGLLWSNIHGIEYPVMLLIVLAYLAESFWNQWRKRGEKKGKYLNWCLILTCYTIFLTPGMTSLLYTPLEISYGMGRFEYLYINELKPLSWQTLFTYSIFPFANLLATSQHLFIVLSLCIFLICLFKRNLRISHFLLFAGALALLVQHLRFGYEFILLTLPLVGHFIRSSSWPRLASGRLSVYIVLPLLLLIPLATYVDYFKFHPRYPFSTTNLPTGVVAFLNRINIGGKVLNNWNTGGFLNWALNKNYKIAMDLQGAIFSDEDFAVVTNALSNQSAFLRFIGQYDPTFISVPIDRKDFSKFIGPHPQFVPVFLDHNEVLFMNKNHFPELADRHRLKAIDPFHIQHQDIEKLPNDQIEAVYREAHQLLEGDADNAIAHWLVGKQRVIEKNYPEALTRAEVLIRSQPELPVGHILKADTLREMERYQEAARSYRTALDRGGITSMKPVQRNLFVVYTKLKEYKKAYRLYAQMLNPFDGNAGHREIYELAIAAAAAGKRQEALLFMKMALLKVPPDDEEYTGKINEMLSVLTSPS